jgi:hypothetical protein
MNSVRLVVWYFGDHPMDAEADESWEWKGGGCGAVE